MPVRLIAAALLLASLGCPSASTVDTSPRVKTVAPPANATGVRPDAALTATLAQDIDPSTASANFTLSTAAGNVSGTVSVSADTLTFTPAADLAPATQHTATIAAGLKFMDGHALGTAYAWTFTTGPAIDRTAPTVASTVPAAGSTTAAPGAKITATFSEPMAVSTVSASTFTLAAGGTAVTGSVSLTGATATFTPSAALTPFTLYTATISSAVKDLAGNAMAADFSWSFTTGAGPDTTPPTVISTLPAAGATAVALAATVKATFSEPMTVSTVTTASFQLHKQGVTSAVSATVTCDGTTATLTPSSPLAPGTVYTAQVKNTAKDVAGNPATAFSWTFTTLDTVPPAVASTSPASGATGVASNASVSATFSEELDSSTINASTFTLDHSVTATVSYAGGTATLLPSSALLASTTYTATLSAGVKDLAGNALASAYTWQFTTGAGADTTPPTVLSTVPDTAATGASIAAPIKATFSEPVAPASVTAASFTVTAHGAAAVTGTLAVSGAVATFTPATPLAYGTQYDAALSTAVKDLAGNALAAAYSWSFTTGSAPAVAIDEIHANPAAGAAGDANGDGVRDSNADEFVEVINTGAADADLGGLQLKVADTLKFTFPTGTTLSAGGRAVVFGGGIPTGSFGSARVFTASLSLVNGGAAVALVRPDGSQADAFTYPAASTASFVRQPEGTGSFVLHNTLAGAALWSPGVAADKAIPKVNLVLSAPAPDTFNVQPTASITVQFNLPMTAADLNGTNLKLYASDCATASPEVAATVTSLAGGTQASIAQSAPLAGGLKHCVKVAQAVHNAAGTATLLADVQWEFTTASIAFNLTQATPGSATSLALQFSAPPNATQAGDATLYCIGSGADVSCATSQLGVSAAALSGSTVTLTLAAQTPGASYRVFVQGVTRASDGAALATASVPFSGYSAPAFAVQSAVAPSATQLLVTYTSDYTAGAAAEQSSSYCIAPSADADCTQHPLAVSAAAAGSSASVLLTTAAQTPNVGYRVYVTGVTRASDGAALTASTATFPGFNLIQNGSFEAQLGTPVTGWTTTTAQSALLTAAAPTGVPAHQGSNVASFPTLTTSISGREAHSSCFPVQTGGSAAKPTVTGWLRTPQPVVQSKAAFKFYFFSDAGCGTPVTCTVCTQTAFSLAAPDTWEQHTFQPSGVVPAGTLSGYVSVRAQSDVSADNGNALYFDDLVVSQ